jgi:hypothetical protein
MVVVAGTCPAGGDPTSADPGQSGPWHRGEGAGETTAGPHSTVGAVPQSEAWRITSRAPPLAEVGTLRPERAVLAMPWVEPRRVVVPTEDPFLRVVHQRGEVPRACRPPRTAGEAGWGTRNTRAWVLEHGEGEEVAPADAVIASWALALGNE